MISSICGTALQSMHRASSGIVKEAKRISKAFIKEPPTRDVTRSIVKFKQHSHQFTASAKLVKVADRMAGHVIDILA